MAKAKAKTKLAKRLETVACKYEVANFKLFIYEGGKANVTATVDGMLKRFAIMGDDINSHNRQKIIAMITAYIYGGYTYKEEPSNDS